MIVAVITFVVGMVWIVSDIIFNTKASIPISEKLQSSLEPINPAFSSRILEVIKDETLSTNEITVNAPLTAPAVETAPTLDLETPIPSATPLPSIAPLQSLQPSPTTNPNLVPLITVPSPATSSANPVPTI